MRKYRVISMSDKREAIRVMQPDGTIKILFRDKRLDQVESHKDESVKESQGKAEKKHGKGSGEERYFNPLFPHVDIFGKDLIGKNMSITLFTGEIIKCSLTGFGQYDVLVESEGKSIILMKSGIIKIEVL